MRAWGHLWASGAVLALAVSAAGQPIEQERFDGHRVVRVELHSARDARVMLALSDDPWTCAWGGTEADTPATVDFRVAPRAFEALQDSGLSFRVLIDDVQRLVDEERAAVARPAARGADAWYAAYKDRAAISAHLDALVAQHPGLATRITAGRSLEGREIFGVRIAVPLAPGQAQKPSILINAAQHAREWATPMTAMYLAERLLSGAAADARLRALLDAFDVYIVPVTNPDGYEYSWTANRMWRKNRRPNAGGTFGVDTNRNWGQGWGGPGASSEPRNETFRGASAFSEPETQAVRALAQSIPRLVLHIDVHSYSQLILEPWSYTATLPPDAAAFESLTTAMQKAVFASAGQVYSAGPGWRTIYPASGTMPDWVNADRGAIALCTEVRDRGQTGFLLPADQILPTAREWTDGLLAAARWLRENTLHLSLVDGPLESVHADGVTPLRVRVGRGLKRPASSPSPTLHARVGRTGAFSAAPLAVAGSDELGAILTGALPGGPCGSVTQFYVTATAADGSLVSMPAGGPDAPFEAVASSRATLFTDDFESNLGWTPGTLELGDTAGEGAWVRGDPAGTVAQPEHDRTPLAGSACAFTGANWPGDEGIGDVDGIKTLYSPVFDLRAARRPRASFWLWFSNNRTTGPITDPLLVEATTDAGAASPTWTPVLVIPADAPPPVAAGRWVRHTVDLSPLPPNAAVRLRFVASDGGSGVVEAALDDFRIESVLCDRPACAADADGNGATDIRDVFAFLQFWFAGRGDLDGSDATDVRDIFAFLSAWFAGC